MKARDKHRGPEFPTRHLQIRRRALLREVHAFVRWLTHAKRLQLCKWLQRDAALNVLIPVGMTTMQRAFALFELLLIIVALAVAAAFILPRVARTHSHQACRVGCSNNLKQIGLAFKTYSIDYEDRYPMEPRKATGSSFEYSPTEAPWKVFQVMSNELSTTRILLCPMENSRRYATNFSSDLNNSRVSYFVNWDATNGMPNMILGGDRNLIVNNKAAQGLVGLSTNSVVSWGSGLHEKQGYILMNDGSVASTDSTTLQDLVSELPQPVRLAVP